MSSMLFTLITFFLSACTTFICIGQEEQSTVNTTLYEIVTERIDGPANVRDGKNGKLLFSLHDNVRVSCTPIKDNWYQVGIRMDIDSLEKDIRMVQNGRDIIIDGKVSGKIHSDIEVYPQYFEGGYKVEIIGYTYRDNIRPPSIIENVFIDYVGHLKGQTSVKDFQRFIYIFDLQHTKMAGLDIYFNYENWLEDPSPMWRFGLVFEDGNFIAVLHSRPLNIEGMTDNNLGRGFDCLVLDEYSNADKIVDIFKQFVHSVD